MDKISTKNIIIIIIAVIAAIAIIFGAAAYNGHKDSQPINAEAEAEETGGEEEIEGIEVITDDETEEDSEEEEQTASEPEPEITRYYGGTYLIGEEMQAGEYVLGPNTQEGSFEIVSDLSGEKSSLIAGGSYNVRVYVTVEEGQYLKFDGVAVAAEDAEAYIPKDSIYQHTGMYLVGKDIQPKQYLAKLDTEDGSEGYIEVTRDSKWSEDSVLEQYTVEEDMTISLNEDTYVRVVGVKLREPY
ncbi:MAG: hypothetical protein LUG24_00685 [Clostridiales bacterium]|nr:hypothetical protein [Clostridiales bacterium]